MKRFRKEAEGIDAQNGAAAGKMTVAPGATATALPGTPAINPMMTMMMMNMMMQNNTNKVAHTHFHTKYSRFVAFKLE